MVKPRRTLHLRALRPRRAWAVLLLVSIWEFGENRPEADSGLRFLRPKERNALGTRNCVREVEPKIRSLFDQITEPLTLFLTNRDFLVFQHEKVVFASGMGFEECCRL